MDEKLKATIQKIKRLSEQNLEFAQEMQKMFGNSSSASVVPISTEVSKDVKTIREALEIRANCSIEYGFVKDQRTRDQLIIDNLRMENAALNLKLDEDERFYVFCVNAFYQIENIINYYFVVMSPDIEDLIHVVEEYTKKESNGKFIYIRNNKEKSVCDIQIAHKINAICNILLPGDSIKSTLSIVRQVRNLDVHRSYVQDGKEENKYLSNFIKEKSFDKVRKNIIILVNSIRDNLGNLHKTKEAIITSINSGCCFVKFDGETKRIPDKLNNKIKDKSVGDSILISLINEQIIDVSMQTE